MKKNKIKKEEMSSLGGSWSFTLDNLHLYAYWEEAFSKEECEKIVKYANNRSLITATTLGKTDIRKSEVSWLPVNQETAWIFKRITDIVVNLNSRFFNFDIHGISEGLQYTSYKAPGDKYGKHIDRATGMVIRKLTVSIQLTDPKKYEGGELCLYDEDHPNIMSKEQGFLSLFPSYVLHEAKPVTKGERSALVTWITGPQFR